MNRRLFSAMSLAVCALMSAPAFAQNKMVMGVSVPAATHGWTGGVVYWANRTKTELEKQYPGSTVIVRTASSAAEQANQVQDLQTVNKINTLVILPFESAPLTRPRHKMPMSPATTPASARWPANTWPRKWVARATSSSCAAFRP
jgi:ribose transport system substrate-binding protein